MLLKLCLFAGNISIHLLYIISLIAKFCLLYICVVMCSNPLLEYASVTLLGTKFIRSHLSLAKLAVDEVFLI